MLLLLSADLFQNELFSKMQSELTIIQTFVGVGVKVPSVSIVDYMH